MRLIVMLLMALFYPLAVVQADPSLTLANTYQRGVNLADYWVSEKYDGVRGYWDGKQLLSRQNKPIPAPESFLQQLPNFALDGELWFGRGEFGRASALVHRDSGSSDYLAEWQQVRYMVFDAPSTRGSFRVRYAKLKTLEHLNRPNVFVVQQSSVDSHAELMQQLKAITADGAEGLMLRRIDAPYQGGRSNDLLKLKIRQDAEAMVLAHLPGKGKYTGKLGSLLVKQKDTGQEFRIGTGFTDAERENPPPIGSIITFQYTGYTTKGLPRFPVYWRLRDE